MNGYIGVKSQFYAHSGASRDGADWQLLVDHLQKVAQLAANNAQVFKAHDLAYIIGLLHDLGKYSQAFQERLRG
ncbi:MAG: CRISPR-associated endonuclease Cas3'', partial [Methylophilaceae bacterium]|nr:CRISPR-associated endonuclease Cas3'' [Methylophilaceae bacterium]